MTRKYSYNRQYFKNIDTPAKAYWVGFIVGDGWLKEQRAISLNLSGKDEILLQNFIDEIGGDYKQIKVYVSCGKYDTRCLWVGSKQMVNDLIKIGVPHKNKSFTAKPLNIPFMSAFYLGLFDADGSVCLSTLKRNSKYKFYEYKRIKITLTGTKSICTAFSKFLGYEGKYVYPIKNKNVYEFSKVGKFMPKYIYKKLYEYDIPCLERKKEIFERWMDGAL